MKLKKRLNLKEKREKIKQIINLVNDYFSVECNIANRKRGVILPRQIAIYLITENIVIGTAEIGKMFKGRSNKHLGHATIIHNRDKIKDYLSINDKDITRHVNELKDDAKLISEMNTEDLTKHKLRIEINEKLKSFDLQTLIDFNNKIAV